ncbi:histidine kinase [Crossiella sp. CA198]|uniref:sensor histidine kinase n=1 Tax=Crossiella sp. CA198 TaxID=3455607 RepID=UPI003F8D0401
MSESCIPRFGSRALLVTDALVAVVVVVVAGVRTAYGFTPVGGLAASWVLAVAVGAPLAVRRRWPTAVLGVVLVAATLATLAEVAGDVVAPAVAFALYPVALAASVRRATVALVVTLGVVVAAGLIRAVLPVASPPGVESFGRTPVSALLYVCVVVGVGWALARAVRARRDHAAQVAELRALRAVAEERLRIARDIHDVVGHSLSLIALRAAVAGHLADQGHPALSEIETISRRALADVRTVLGALRDVADPEPDARPLERLVADSRLVGLDVRLVAPDLSAVSESVRVSAYRIVQEALTNVVRHAQTRECRVRLAVEENELLVEIEDDGPARGPIGPSGHGHVGMRERAALHRGSVVVGPRAEGGFAVRARLPLRRGDD